MTASLRQPNRRQLLRAGLHASVLGGVGLAAPTATWAWDGPNNSTAPDDVAIVRDILETLHPGLTRYQTPRQFDAAHRQFARDWAADDRLEARYLALSRLLARIRCGHSYANFFNQSEAVASALFDRPTRLPFAFRWLDDAIVVTADHSGAGGRTALALPPGTLIKAVDGVPVRQMLHRVLPYVRVDGHNPGKARALLSVSGVERYEFFDIFHGLLFGPPDGGRFRLRLRTPGATRDQGVAAPALTLGERRSMMPTAAVEGLSAGEQWQWTERPDGVTILRMDGWDVFNSRWDWQGWLNARLDSLRPSDGLVIDLRQNEGGLDCGDPILARLATTVLPQPAGRRLVRYRRVPDRLRPWLDTWDDSFFDWGDDATPYDAGRFALRGEGGEEGIVPDQRRLTNRVAVLTSARTAAPPSSSRCG